MPPERVRVGRATLNPQAAARETTLGGTLREAIASLATISETPRLEAELLLAEATGLRRGQLLTHDGCALSAGVARRFQELVARRLSREPLAYVLGRRAFYDLELGIAPGVLVPRPESERLVEETLTWCRARDAGRGWRIADVGTGSGALAIALARHLSRAWVCAVDRSAAALAVAARNVARHGLGARVQLLQGDLLAAAVGRFDVLVANLPYIPSSRIAALAPEVSRYEPRLALDGGADGLALVRRLLAQAPDRLASPGLLLLEIDEGQGSAVVEAARRHLPAAEARVLRDYAGLERVVHIERHRVRR